MRQFTKISPTQKKCVKHREKWQKHCRNIELCKSGVSFLILGVSQLLSSCVSEENCNACNAAEKSSPSTLYGRNDRGWIALNTCWFAAELLQIKYLLINNARCFAGSNWTGEGWRNENFWPTSAVLFSSIFFFLLLVNSVKLSNSYFSGNLIWIIVIFVLMLLVCSSGNLLFIFICIYMWANFSDAFCCWWLCYHGEFFI